MGKEKELALQDYITTGMVHLTALCQAHYAFRSEENKVHDIWMPNNISGKSHSQS